MVTRFSTSERLKHRFGSFTVGADGDECCVCDRPMAPGEIGYRGGMEFLGDCSEPSDWFCRRCAFNRCRFDPTLDEWCRRRWGEYRHNRRFNKFIAAPRPSRPRLEDMARKGRPIVRW